MKTKILFLALALVALAGSAEAQVRRPAADREAYRARRAAMASRAAMEQHREAIRQRIANLPAEQREFLQALRAERSGVIEQVKAGTLTRLEAREAIRAWVQANRPARPTR